jgi:hypothetical protein
MKRLLEPSQGLTAKGRLASLTSVATAALAQGGKYDVIAWGYFCDVDADGLDDSRGLVTHYERSGYLKRAVCACKVAVTQPGGHHSNANLVGPNLSDI